MTNWTKLKKAIADVIKTNGNQEITGAIMQHTLISIVDNLGDNAQFGGVAVPSTVPADTDGSLFYLAATQGTYPNFNNIEVDASEMAVFTKDTAGTWVKASLPIQHPTIKKPLLIGGNVAAVTKGTGVVLSVPTLNADGTETASELSIEAATPSNNGAMTKEQVNTLKEVDDFYTNMTDYVIGDNDDAALINIEITQQNSINLKYKTLDTVNGDKKEKTKAIPAVSPENGVAGVAGMNLIHDIPYFFDFYRPGFPALPDGSDITKVLIPKFRANYDGFDDLYTDVPAIQNKVFANPKAGDRILIGSLVPVGTVGTVPLWATVTSAQRISGVYSVTVDYDGDTYIFAYTSANDIATLSVPWNKVSSKRNIYSSDIKDLTPSLSEANIKDLLTPMVYRKYGVVYPVKPQTGDLMEEVTNDESRYVTITALRNQENPDEYTDIIIPFSGKDNRVHKIVLKNDLTSVQSSKKTILENYRRRYDGKLLLALDTEKAVTIKNSILDAYSYSVEQIGSAFEARLPKVGDLIIIDNSDVPVCEVLLDSADVQHTRWFSQGKLYEVLVNTALTRVPEDPKVIYDTTSGTLRDLYISAGAKYNETTGYYELNGLTDITEEEMRAIYTQWQKDVGTASHNTGWLTLPPKMRTNLPSLYRADLISGLSNCIGGLSVEVLCIAEQSNDTRVMYVASTQAVAQNDMPKLRRVIGVWRYNDNNPSNFNFSYGQPFSKCPLLEEIRMARINKSHTFAVSPNLSKESVLYMITNANPPSGAAVGSIAITLHPTAYARLKDDADIVAALEAKGGIVTLVSA